MAAYRAVLREVFPGRPVGCTLVWTHTAQVSPLPDALLDAHAPGGGRACTVIPEKRESMTPHQLRSPMCSHVSRGISVLIRPPWHAN